MGTPPIPEALLNEVVEALHECGGVRLRAAAKLGISKSTFDHRLRAAALRLPKRMHTVSIAPPPDPDEPLADLLARKKAGMVRAKEHEEWASLIDVKVKDRGPIGLLLVGDPHVDDDHCDIERLESDLTTVGKTDGFYAGHVGDLTNNWIGRLAALYANQSTTFSDGLRLTEWMLALCPSLFVVNGNHDLFGQGGDILRYIMKSHAGVNRSHGVRMALRWPGGQEIRLHARHDFPGKSQFSSTHGMKREILFGHRDHILVAGHTHVDEARIEPSLDGQAHWMFRVSGYKVIDDYAETHRFRPQRLAPSVALVIRPDAIPAEQVKPFWDPAMAAEYLTFLRRKK